MIIKGQCLSAPDVARFWSMVDIRSADECWPWMFARFESGYGSFSFSVNGKKFSARSNRVAFVIANGPLSDDEHARHSCDFPPCCNPNHLLAGSGDDNVADRVKRNRSANGARINTVKLTPKQVLAIRDDDRPQRVIAREYGVCKSTIGYAKRGESWRNLS